jgi:hypothetical protein
LNNAQSSNITPIRITSTFGDEIAIYTRVPNGVFAYSREVDFDECFQFVHDLIAAVQVCETIMEKAQTFVPPEPHERPDPLENAQKISQIEEIMELGRLRWHFRDNICVK